MVVSLREFAAALGCVLFAAASASASAAAAPDRLRVPPGFKIELLTDEVPNARAMTLGRYADGKGVLYVGSMGAGKVYAVELDQGRVTRVRTIASGLELPAGVAYRNGQLYVSAVSRILRFDAIDDRLANPPAPAVVTDKLPSERHHGAKFIGFGPDGWLYVAVGVPCNICEPGAAHGNIQRMKPDGSGAEIVARGVRNSVGFDWSPLDRTLWFSDNGRDLLGDEVPSDELNRVTQNGQHFGYPYCHQGDVADPQFGAQHRCSEFVAPAAKLGAHVATLGLRFYSGSQFPAEYRHNLFVAEHGSWNRSTKSGYQVVRVVLDGQGRVLRDEPFVQGFLRVDNDGRETVLGRPADVLPLPDGSLLVSDDLGGAIYRVRYAP
ncbi:MAG TPA: PQQ-dependent sugar dehydrogenase [Burkholderiaceae bacterium]